MQTEGCTNHCGWISEPFQVKRGIKQGCPVAPLPFVLVVEILAIKIRGRNIKGIQTDTSFSAHPTPQKTIIKIQQFAGDTTVFLKDKEDLDAAITAFNQFENISGSRMHNQKTEVMWLGRGKNNREEHQNLK